MPLVGGVFYAVRGAGSPLLCIHGAGGSHTHWGHLLAGLADVVRVIAPDLPGHGRSAPPACISCTDYGTAVLALLDALGLERAILVGHSMGAAVALEAAVAAPRRVAGLVLIGAAARLRVAPGLITGLGEDPAAAVEQLVAAMYPDGSAHLRAAAAAEYLHAPALLQSDLRACDGWDIRPRLVRATAPALVVAGELDMLTPLKLAGELRDLLGATLVTLPGIGHAPMLEAPEATVAALRGYLGTLER